MKPRKQNPAIVILLLAVGLILASCAASEAEPPLPTATVFRPQTETPASPPPPTASVPSPTNTTQPAEAETPTGDPSPVSVSDFPDPADYQWTLVAEGLTKPVGLASPGDDSGRLFILEQPGRIRIIREGQLLETPFLDIRDRVGDSANEQGLLGLAFHPQYADNGYFYVNYTDQKGDTVVARFQVSGDPNRGNPDSEVQLLNIPQPYGNHNGGQVSFGPQGYLWVSTGDGGSAGDPQGNAQSLDTLLGKLLRIEVGEGEARVPQDNPFGDEIWAYGLRNPWRFTHDPATGDLYIADVGQNQWEEINYTPAGAEGGINYGWDYREGAHPFEGTPPDDAELVDPVWEYGHPRGCSISGGAVYRGGLEDWQGIYLYGDYCTGEVWGLLKTPQGEWINKSLFQTNTQLVAVSQDAAGEVYLLDIRGSILRLDSN